jgi:uncharacterized protein
VELRRIKLDFSDAKIIFDEDQPEFCHLLGGISSMLHHLENFLMKNVREARKHLDETADPTLAADVDVFCQQEGWHSRLHAQFNKKLMRSGYPWMGERADRMKNDFDGFLANRSAKFCLAYTEGFETFGPIVSQFFFERSGTLMKDWDEPTVYLWVWHFAEEYEHRSVANRLYAALHDDYFYRIFALWYTVIHLFWYSILAAKSMIDADIETGRIPVGKFRSYVRFGRSLASFLGFILPRVVRTMSPHYDPERIPPPRQCLEFLADASQRYAVATPEGAEPNVSN